MTSFSKFLLASVALVAAPTFAQQRDPLAPKPTEPLVPVTVHRQAPPPVSPVIASLNADSMRDDVIALARRFNGKAGVSIINLRDGSEIAWNGGVLFPQQSCSKLWVSLAAMDAIDRGKVTLSDKVTIGRQDLVLFNQPMAALVGKKGSHTTTISDLINRAITQSDNLANDSLMRGIGGPSAVRDMIERKGLGSIRFYDGERSLQSKIAGLTWSQSYSIGNAFYKARSALPMSVRKAAFERYIDDPYDGAAPHAVATALGRLKKGELLSPSSTRYLLDTMGRTRTGHARVRAALAPGWSWNHKTGTGQVLGGRIGGLNDIGLLTAPDGTVYAMAIMTVPNKSDGAAQGFMQSVTKAVIRNHRAR